MRSVGIALVTAALFLAGSQTTRADIIVNQAPNGGNIVSQVFPDFPAFSTYSFDDFTTTQAYQLTSLTAFGTEAGDPSQNVSVTAEIWNGLPGSGSMILSFTGSEDGAGSLNFSLGNALLPAGSYWLTAYVTRPDNPGGQWFFDTSNLVQPSQAYVWNPGGGFGFGTSPFPIENVTGVPENLAYILQGTAAVPEPTSLTLLGIGMAFLAWRKRKQSGAQAAA
jgi:PEP-CTERM motif